MSTEVTSRSTILYSMWSDFDLVVAEQVTGEPSAYSLSKTIVFGPSSQVVSYILYV